MTSDVQVFGKDKIKLNILQDVLGGFVNISFQLNNDPAQNYASQIHADGKRVYAFGKFNITEDVNEGDTLTIRPIVIDAPLKISLHANANFSGKKVSVVRNSTKTVELEFEISSETTYIELLPQGKQFYLMKVSNGDGIAATPIQSISPQPQRKSAAKGKTDPVSTKKLAQPLVQYEEVIAPTQDTLSVDDRFEGYDLGTGFTGSDNRFNSAEVIADKAQEQALYSNAPAMHTIIPQQDDRDLQRIEQEISVIEHQQEQLSRKKQSAIDHLEKIEAEYKKDYASFEQELEDYKSRMDADASIIEYYKDQDVVPIEIILQEVRLKLDEAEKQIRFFIEAKQHKTMEIENEIKFNKKQ